MLLEGVVVVVVVVVRAKLSNTRVCPAMRTNATSWGGRTPGSQTPGVPATPEPSTTNNYWRDGVRKMPQHAAKYGKKHTQTRLKIVTELCR